MKAIPLLDYIDDLDRSGAVSHEVALHLKRRIAESVPEIPSPDSKLEAYRKALEEIRDSRWNENADLDAICTIADQTLAAGG